MLFSGVATAAFSLSAAGERFSLVFEKEASSFGERFRYTAVNNSENEKTYRSRVAIFFIQYGLMKYESKKSLADAQAQEYGR